MAADPHQSTVDPFASQRAAEENLSDEGPGSLESSPTSPTQRRTSREWDASKVPPSQFQKRKGSIYGTPGSRDGHLDSAQTRDKSFHDKLKEKGWIK